MSVEGHDTDVIGNGTELARYRLSVGERVLVGSRAPGGIEVSDYPADGTGTVYPVDRGFRCFEQLSAFVADYLHQAKLLDASPMSRQGIGTMLARSEDAELPEAMLGGGGG